MSVSVAILDGPLPPSSQSELVGGAGCGAWVCFEGIVRAAEDRRAITALRYEAYEPMARNLLTELAEEVLSRHGLIGVHVVHSRGIVPVGACSFRLTILAAHRKPALAAMDEFIDRMKKDVPIWKNAVWAG